MSDVQPTASKIVPKAGRSTPDTLYAWAGVIAFLLLIVAALSFLAVQTMSSTGDRIENSTGPVLITTQGLVASIAEADAANSTVFLSAVDGGDEDVSQRRLYESAIARAPQQIEDISAGIGDDEASHDALKRVAQQLTEYSGVVEQARFSNFNDLDEAEELLADSLELTGGASGMLSNAEEVTTRTRDQFVDDLSAGNVTVLAALAAIVITFVVLLVAQFRLKALSKRLLNFGLVASTICVVALFAWLVVASAFRASDLSSAEAEGFGDISGNADLLTAAFDYKTQEANAIIASNAALLPDQQLGIEISSRIAGLDSSEDTLRERALVVELNERWDRYLTASASIRTLLQSNDDDGARAQVAASNQSFNGFNTTAEALSLFNQDEFTASVLDANARLQWLSIGALLLPLIAALLAWLGYRPRINEYF